MRVALLSLIQCMQLQSGLNGYTLKLSLLHICFSQPPETWECRLGSGEGSNLTVVHISKSEPEHCVRLLQQPTGPLANENGNYSCHIQ